MLVQPLQTMDLRLVPGAAPVTEPKVAVVLNANARKVNEKVVRSLSHVVPEDDLFLSRSEPDARRIAHTVLERRYDTVFCGGGDGTFMGFVNETFRQLDARRRYYPATAPRFGVLKLGTGNGLASLVAASPLRNDGILDDVLRARAGEVPGYRHLDMLLIDGKRTHFAGVGVDGKLLNDYVWLKQNMAKGMLRNVFTGASGYFSSVAFKTVPHYLTHSTAVECEVINGRGTAYRLGPDGEPVQEFSPGEVLFSGPAMMASAGTIPYYGFGLKMFPFAGRKRGFMHLRVGSLPVPVILANLVPLWNGKWFPKGIQDFHAREVTLRFARPMPLQMGGDGEGYRDELTIGLAPEAVEMVDFSGSVH